jgi:hypothetical protein
VSTNITHKKSKYSKYEIKNQTPIIILYAVTFLYLKYMHVLMLITAEAYD